MIVFDADDMGANHVISDMCQSHDCRDQLDKFHIANPHFKATLFAIPGEMTQELLNWCLTNEGWIELAVHGFYHTSNYECEKMTHTEAMNAYVDFADMINDYFGRDFKVGFKAPGWQISDEMYEFCRTMKWWVADQAYNDERRPKDLPVYIIGDNSRHFHTWDCMGNGVYELEKQILEQIKDETEFKFVSEMVV